MSDVVDLGGERSRRRGHGYSAAKLAELDQMWDELTTPPRWTDENEGWRALADAIAGRPGAFEWADATPESTAAAKRALRILHSTDRGSDDGNAEGDGRDSPPAR